MAVKVRVRVLEGWAVCVDGVQRSGGAIVEVDAGTASKWLVLGWVEPVKAERGKAASRSKRSTVPVKGDAG